MKKNQGLIFLTIALLLLTACGPENQTDGSDSTEAAPLPQAEATVEAVSATLINRDILLDPARAQDADSLLINSYLYEGLVTMNANGEIEPGIAQSWTVSDDGLAYIFEIRPNARFSDGSPITVDAIEENFNRWFEPQNPLHGDGNYPTWLARFLAFNGQRDAQDRNISQVDGIQKVDVNTVIVHLNRAEPQLLSYLAEPAFSILSPAMLVSPGYGTRSSTLVSSGRYVVTAWTEEGLTLSPNPQYWNATDGNNLNFVWK